MADPSQSGRRAVTIPGPSLRTEGLTRTAVDAMRHAVTVLTEAPRAFLAPFRR